MQLDVAGMQVAYSESGLQTNVIPSYSWDRLALQCRNVNDHTLRALERRIDGIYTRLLRKALDVSWQQHMTNQELYGKIPSAMHQLRERRLTLPVTATGVRITVKHLVLWEGRAGRMLRGQANRMTYVKQLLRDSCCETVDELQRTMKNRVEWARASHTTSSSE